MSRLRGLPGQRLPLWIRSWPVLLAPGKPAECAPSACRPAFSYSSRSSSGSPLKVPKVTPLPYHPWQPEPRRAGGFRRIGVPAAASLRGRRGTARGLALSPHSYPIPASGTRGHLSHPASGNSFQAARSDPGRRDGSGDHFGRWPRPRSPRPPAYLDDGPRARRRAPSRTRVRGDDSAPRVHKGPVMAPRTPQRDPAGGREREERGKAFFPPFLSLFEPK